MPLEYVLQTLQAFHQWKASIQPVDCVLAEPAGACHCLGLPWAVCWHCQAVNSGVSPDCRQIAFCIEEQGLGENADPNCLGY